jgi:anti-sigma regulatory factor (Ser/Thr protein kinase)
MPGAAHHRSMSIDATHRLPHGPTAPAAAREAVDVALAGRLAQDGLAELRLLVSELVTNAVRHGLDRRGAVELTLRLAGRCLRVEVADGGAGFTPPTGGHDPEDPGGWGLVVVDELVDRWGIDAAGGTRVWFERNV